MTIPVIINNRDLLTWPKAMVYKLLQYECIGDIIIVDNGSTYKPLLEWYDNQSVAKVIMCDNLGHGGAWVSGAVSSLNSDIYVVTDSDLGLQHTPNDTLVVLLDKLNKHPELEKIGLGLDWQIVKEDSPYYQRLNLYERDRWKASAIIDDVYVDMWTDTTFALYNKKQYFIGGGSLSYPYVARHYPWELPIEYNNDEFKYYIDHASDSCTYKMIVPNK